MSVDGKQTAGDARSTPLALGCHVISTAADLPGMGRSLAKMKAHKAYFVIDAAAGHHYIIERDVHSYEEHWRAMVVTMKDIDPQGRVVSSIRGFGSPPEACPTHLRK